MDGERQSPSSSAPYIGGDMGAGGKFRKPPLRKKPGTPYDRPPTASNQPPPQRRWLSMLVDPACRLIAGSATKILPSFFSRSSSTFDLSSSDNDDLDKWGTEATTNASNDVNRALNLAISKTNGEAGPSKVNDRLKDNSECDELEQDTTRNLCDDSELSKIEQLVKGKMFSRDEIDHLTEILNSRVVDINDIEGEKKEPRLSIGGEAKMNLLSNGSPLTLIDGKQEDMNRAILGTSTSHLQSKVRDDVASPVDLARAYMGSRTSDMGLGSYSIRAKDERALQQQGGDELAPRPFLPPPSPKSSICWPGAMVQDQRGYTTPKSQRGTFGLHNLPRTPYSRTIFSKSKGKLTQLQAADSRSLNISSAPFQQSRTPIYGQSRTNVAEDGYRSVGPIRRLRNKLASETGPKGSSSLYSVRNSPPEVEKASVSKGFLPITEKNAERGGTSSSSKYNSVEHTAHNHEEGGAQFLNSPSNETVRKILEQLDRHKPTPKEIEAEMKLATSWKRPSEGTDFKPKENTRLGSLGGFDFNKNKDLGDQQFSAEGNEDGGNFNFKSNPLLTDIVSKTSRTVVGDHGSRQDTNAGPSGVKKTSDSHIKSTHKKDSAVTNSVPKDTSQLWPFNSQLNGQDLTSKPPSGPRSGSLDKSPFNSKPTLKHISINKPDPKRIVSNDNGINFTFPVSETSSVLSEPPTPSILPSFITSVPSQTKEGPLVPTYTFGTKKATQRLVFSFPSTSEGSEGDVEGSDIKFKFGSDKKSRISFSSVGKDAICF